MQFKCFITTIVLVAVVQLIECNQQKHGEGQSNEKQRGHHAAITSRECQCPTKQHENPCSYNSSTFSVGCSGTNKYLLCNKNTCSNQTCSKGQVWSTTAGECAACSTGYQLSADNEKCVCNKGTILKGNSCEPCAKGATIQQYKCFCPNTTVFDPNTYACRGCPASSVLKNGRCLCNRGTFWNAGAWQCQACPGTLSTVSEGRHQNVLICTCNKPNQIFNEQKVACISCPAGTTASVKGVRQECLCTIHGQFFNATSGLCQCPRGVPLNSAGTGCQLPPRPPGKREGPDGRKGSGRDRK